MLRTAAVALYLCWGLLYVAIGIGAPLAHRFSSGPPGGQFFHGAEQDTRIYGAPPADVLQRQPATRILLRTAADLVGLFLTPLGVLITAVAWFGVRAGQGWAVAALALTYGVVLVMYFGPFLEPVRAHGASWPFHPFLHLPLVLVPVATGLALASLRSGS